jgi:hypothetical protein
MDNRAYVTVQSFAGHTNHSGDGLTVSLDFEANVIDFLSIPAIVAGSNLSEVSDIPSISARMSHPA